MNDNTVTLRRAKGWQLALGVITQVVPTMFVIMMTFASYVATGAYGATSVLAGTIITGSRLFDSVTDPLIGLLADRLNGKFGRIRPLLVLGYIISGGAILSMFVFFTNSNNIFVFILIYLVYIVGYTIFNTGDMMVASVITEDPAQRPMVGRWAAVFKTIMAGSFSIVLSATLMPKHNFKMGLPLFQDLAFLVVGFAGLCVLLSVFAITSSGNDVAETYKGTKKEPLKMKEMMAMLRNNRPLQMFTIAAASDKLALTTATQSAITIMIFGIVIGNYAFNASISLANMIVTIVMLFVSSGLAKRDGLKKSLTRWTIITTIAYIATLVFMLFVDTLQISINPVLKVAFILLFVSMGAGKMIVSSCTQPMIADIADYEFSRTGRFSPSVIAMTYSFVDKMVSSVSATVVAVAVSLIGFVDVMPQATDPLSSPILFVALFLWLGMPIIGYLTTLVAMKFYKLDNETMDEIRKENAKTRATLSAS